MTMQTISIFLYTNEEHQQIPLETDEKCEIVCRKLCQRLQITPATCLLFGLRISNTNDFLPGSNKLEANGHYEFRVRFQVLELSTLKCMDKMAYNYFFYQLKYDLINGKIEELVYPNYKDQVVGLCVTNMYIEMLENNVSIEYFENNYKKYVPSKHVKKHSLYMRQRISNALRKIKYMNHDSYYVKGTYLETIRTLAPNYFVERCTGIAPYLPEDDLDHGGTCPIDLEFAPYHTERPGLSIYYKYKKLWKHIARIEDIYAIIVEKDSVVRFEMRDTPAGFAVQLSDKQKMESFVSCIAGYYRLMVKWIIDLCRTYPSPSLHTLLTLKCHGPIGGEFSYLKLQEKHNITGSYIIRQCEKVYETYYIDIIASNQPETYKITYDYNTWNLHKIDGIKSFNNLQDVARSIMTKSKQKFRLAPSEYGTCVTLYTFISVKTKLKFTFSDKSSNLLLCLPPSQLTAKKNLDKHIEFEIRQKKAQLLNPVTDFRKYISKFIKCRFISSKSK